MWSRMKCWCGAMILGLAGLVWAAAPGDVFAHGGGHGGGGHGGGHGGGGRGGGWGGGRGYYGGGRGYYGGGYGRGYGGYGGYGYGGLGYGGLGYGGLGYGGLGGLGYGLGGFGRGYGGYGYGGYGGGYGGSGYGYGGYPGSYSSGYYSPGYYDNGYSTPGYSQNPAEQPVYLTITVPPNADVNFNGTRTSQTGRVRQFVSPPLEPGDYQYDIQASWMENGQRVTQTRQLTVHPGEQVAVSFPNSTGKTAPRTQP